MKLSFFNICEDTKGKLGRPLNTIELDFLQWLCDRYKQEKKRDLVD